jgi:hypothetical protein
VPERLPFQQFHSDEGSPIGLVNFVDRADIGMVQRGRSFGLPLEMPRSTKRPRLVGSTGRSSNRPAQNCFTRDTNP